MDEGKDAKAAWGEVGNRFSGLGHRLKQHFDQPPSSEGSEAAEADQSEADQSAADAIKDALRQLGEALDGAVEAVSAAAKDPELAADMRQTGQSFVNAIATTFADVSDDLRRAFTRKPAGDEPDAPTQD